MTRADKLGCYMAGAGSKINPACGDGCSPGHDARSIIYMGWSALKNGDLIAQAQRAI